MMKTPQRIMTSTSSDEESSLVLLSKLGKAVWVLFKDEDDGEEEFYRGEIKQVNLKQENDRSFSIKHYIVFDDGDQIWFDDIQMMEEIGELRWVAPPPRVSSKHEVLFVAANNARETNYAVRSRRPPPVKRKVPEEVTLDSSTSFRNQKRRRREKRVKKQLQEQDHLGFQKEKKRPRRARVKDEVYQEQDHLEDNLNDLSFPKATRTRRATVKEEEEHYLDDNNLNDDDDLLDNEDHHEAEEEDDDDDFLLDDDLTVTTETSFKDEDYEYTYKREDTKRFFKSLEPKTKHWVKKLGLQNAHGTGMRGLAAIDDAFYVKPDSFELLFRLADFLFAEQDYHYRLFGSVTRPGLRVRQKLRDLKKQGEAALACYQYRPDWTPPTKHTMVFIMDKIRDF